MVNRISGIDPEWFEDLPCAITVCDKNYKIMYMNAESAQVNKESGGKALIGKNLMDCHPSGAQEKLRKVMKSGKPNVYTIERGGVRKLAYQIQWKSNGRAGGLLELYFELPKRIPNHLRS